MTEHDLTESQLIGSRIRDARINRRMSQADLADKANISLSQVSDIETGKSSMRLTTFIGIVEAYTPPQKKDWIFFAALRRRELCETYFIN